MVVLLFLVCVLWGLYTAEPEATPTVDPGTTTASPSPVPQDTPTLASTATPGDTAVYTTGASPTMVLPSTTPTFTAIPPGTPTPPNMATETATPTQIAVIATFPSPYVVQRGDTLWGIAEMACGDGRLWPGIWGMNPGIQNPHLIMAGQRVRWAC